jgi:hypothetical protein
MSESVQMRLRGKINGNAFQHTHLLTVFSTPRCRTLSHRIAVTAYCMLELLRLDYAHTHRAIHMTFIFPYHHRFKIFQCGPGGFSLVRDLLHFLLLLAFFIVCAVYFLGGKAHTHTHSYSYQRIITYAQPAFLFLNPDIG